MNAIDVVIVACASVRNARNLKVREFAYDSAFLLARGLLYSGQIDEATYRRATKLAFNALYWRGYEFWLWEQRQAGIVVSPEGGEQQ